MSQASRTSMKELNDGIGSNVSSNQGEARKKKAIKQ
jgi:hypothetical protein